MADKDLYRGSVVRHRRRPDWYVTPQAWLPEVAAVPAVNLGAGNSLEVHLTHLPLLVRQHPEVAALLPVADMTARGQLDEECRQLGFVPRLHQHSGAEFARSRRGTLIADQMRLGKTLCALLAHDPAVGPLVVVAPLAARGVWIDWFRRRWPDEEPAVLKGKTFVPEAVADKRIIFTHYDILPAWQTSFSDTRIGTLVLDEAHVLSNSRTKRTQAVFLLGARAERVIALTGTPLWNRPYDLWAILAILNPGAWGSHYDFGQRYCDPILGTHGTSYLGTSHEEEFRTRLAEVMIRRTWMDVRVDAPPSSRTVEIADITEAQAYRLEVLAEKVRDFSKARVHAGDLARFRRLLGTLKSGAAADAALRVLDGGEPVVVWAWHRDVAYRIAQELADRGHVAYTITGDDDQPLREATIDAWRGCSVAALVVTISVGQVAIDLSHARQAVFAEVDFTPTTIAQAEMRIFSPARPMAITYIVVDHTVDRALVGALCKKCEVAETLGVPAAETAIDVIAGAFGMRPEAADLNRLMCAFVQDYAGSEDDDS